MIGCSPASKCSGAQNAEPTLHVLFIGNSYTYVNDLPATFSRLACSGGHKVETATAANGGWRLADHLASSQTIQKLNEQKWDFVVMQEQSETPAVEYSRAKFMYPAIRGLAARIRDAGAQPVLFLTWGHRDGLPDAGFQSYAEMQSGLDEGYYQIADELSIPVIPVGEAWNQAVTRPDPLDLWQADGSHPNQKGTYLAACVFYAAIFQQNPQGLSFRAGLSTETARDLQNLAASFLPR